jgi:hypothetical protein
VELANVCTAQIRIDIGKRQSVRGRQRKIQVFDGNINVAHRMMSHHGSALECEQQKVWRTCSLETCQTNFRIS